MAEGDNIPAPPPAASESSSAAETEKPLSTVTIIAQTDSSGEATLNTSALGGGDATESTCNNNINEEEEEEEEKADNNEEEGRVVGPEAEPEKTLELAVQLAEKGAAALKENDFAEAADCLSRSLEIRVSHYGEMAPECMSAYYQYGKALLYKAQEEADPLGAVPKKEASEPKQGSDKDAAGKSANGESSVASASSNAEGEGSSHPHDAAQEYGESEDDEDLAEADEDESDLDLAWKMLDVARAIADKLAVDTMDKVDILSTLAEVALEREDIETSLSDYQKALSILEGLVEPDSRYIAELNFRICLCLEIGYKPQEAVPYCQKAISVCKSRIQRLKTEVKSPSESGTSSSAPWVNESSSTGMSLANIEAEIETLAGLSEELEKKLEDLQQLISNPKSILSELLGIVSAKASAGDKASPAVMAPSQLATASSGGGFDSPTISTAHTNGAAGVTHLGVVGRGVKRVLMTSESSDSSPSKKPVVDPSAEKGDGNNC